MTKAEIVAKISEKLGIEKTEVQNVVEHFMEGIKDSLEKGDNVYLRGFGSFIVKTRAEKTGRNISKNTTITIPAHNIPAFKPAKVFVQSVKTALEKTPPELGADIAERGLVLTGGGALLKGLDRLLAEETGLPVMIAEDPLTCVARGTGRALDLIGRLNSIFAPNP